MSEHCVKQTKCGLFCLDSTNLGINYNKLGNKLLSDINIDLFFVTLPSTNQ